MTIEVQNAPSGSSYTSLTIDRALATFSKSTPMRSNIVAGMLINRSAIYPGPVGKSSGIHTINIGITKLPVFTAAQLVYMMMNYIGLETKIYDYYHMLEYRGVFTDWNYTESERINKVLQGFTIPFWGDTFIGVDGTAQYPIKPDIDIGGSIVVDVLQVVNFDFQAKFLSETIEELT